ncbi:11-beta-hydroxysteroid dehydrogenase A-like [Populus nigra]|uniref:11-beta-hydroxysteroid dehydrogenase A-like n=1 Tax=Populus nigra TaxID=3691 RepID=UPI002B26534D|nr:11-beta-hydroxysteroid dehydrogenase A-like [Populus nigra]
MDLIHKVLNIVLPPITLILLLLFFPYFLVSKFISSIKRSINSEKVAGKVVLITGASSGIGEYLAYEYARRGACLALSARREERLRAVADKARELGSPDVIVIATDISKVEDCERFVNEAMNHFGKLDHLVNNAGVAQIDMFEDCKQISEFATIMNTNFWGSVYASHFAIPHLRKSKGRIVGISSIAGWCSVPRMSFYSASKAAITSFYETLRAEFGSDIRITIVTPGVVESEMTQGDFLSKSTERCAKAIVDSACRGDRYLVEPSWARISFLMKVLCPEVLEWWFHRILVAKSSKKSN